MGQVFLKYWGFFTHFYLIISISHLTANNAKEWEAPFRWASLIKLKLICNNKTTIYQLEGSDWSMIYLFAAEEVDISRILWDIELQIVHEIVISRCTVKKMSAIFFKRNLHSKYSKLTWNRISLANAKVILRYCNSKSWKYSLLILFI